MKEYVCIICPRSCLLKVENSIYETTVTGNGCKRGYKYGLEEHTNPVRTVTMNVKVIGGACPVVSAKTARPVALYATLQLALLAKKLSVNAPIKQGDVLFESLLGEKIIATKDVGLI